MAKNKNKQIEFESINTTVGNKKRRIKLESLNATA